MSNQVQNPRTVKHTHPQPETWANYLSICGIDKGVFSEVTANGRGFKVAFENGITVDVQPGKLQTKYTL